MNNLRLIFSSARAASLAVLFATVVTIWAELAPGLKNWLKNLSGHHWLSKSILMLVVYVLAFAAFRYYSKKFVYFDLRKEIRNLVILTVLGAAAILGFFVWHFLAA